MAFLRALSRLLSEEHGQDLIEYALLCGAIGFAGVAAFNSIESVMGTAYGAWVTNANATAVVEMPAPVP
jgi:Flp pilus assembly pilin Flp